MKLAKYWSKQSAPAAVEGKVIQLSCWRGSADSPEEAARLAREAVQRLVQRVEASREWDLPDPYGYSDRPLREEILEELTGATTLAAAITRNAMGVRILNTAHAMFVDVDLAPLGLVDRLKALLGLGPPHRRGQCPRPHRYLARRPSRLGLPPLPNGVDAFDVPTT